MKDQIQNIPQDLKIGYFITISIMMILVLLVVFVVIIYNRRKVNHLKELKHKKVAFENSLLQEQLEKQKAIQKERESFSSDLHDEIGAGISAIKLRIEFIKQVNKEPLIDSELDELLSTSQSLNTTMREMLWNLNNENADLEQLFTFIKNYGTSFFEKTNISFSAQYNFDEVEYPISFSQKKHLIACLKETFNNVYKHSKANYVQVIFNQIEKGISVSIIDDGVGIPENVEKGNGLNNIQKRMQLLNGEAVIISYKNPTKIIFNM